MHLKEKLSQRIGCEDIRVITNSVQGNEPSQEELFSLLFDSDDNIGFRAAWVMSHILPPHNAWIVKCQDALIDEVMTCGHSGKRRVILNVLYLQPLAGLSRIEFLDFCLERMVSKIELPGVQSLCIKIAYEICRPVPELVQELLTTLGMMEVEQSPAVQAAKRNVLHAVRKGKSLQMRQADQAFLFNSPF